MKNTHICSKQVTTMEGGERRTSFTSQTVSEPQYSTHISNMHQHYIQKIEALKKAFADVILNTAKEAGARVMASERRALGYRHELDSTKEEALRMMLRLKQMMDAKTAEADMTSLNQKRKIEELEAQLNEAEDIITDLRAELKHVLLKLEKAKTSQVQSLDGQKIEQVASFEESAKPKTSVSSPTQELECATTNGEVKNRSPTPNGLDDKCCNSTTQTEPLCISNLEDYYAHDSDLASIIIASNEPKLCKNGCTQRVHALEGNLLYEKLRTQGANHQHCGIKKIDVKKHAKCHKKPKKKFFSYCRSCFLSSSRVHINQNCKSNKGACSLPSIRPCAICKWKRKKRRCRHVRTDFSVERCNVDEYAAKMKQVPHMNNVEPLHGSTSVAESVEAVNKFEPAEKTIQKDNELLNFEGSTSHNLSGSNCSMKVEIVGIPYTNTNLENAKAFEENDGSPCQADASRLLKYTFQRKRKRESLGTPDDMTDSETSTVKRVDEKHNGALEPQKSSMIDEPSRRQSVPGSGCS